MPYDAWWMSIIRFGSILNNFFQKKTESNLLKGQLSSLSSHFTEDVEALCRLKMRIILTQFRGETNIEIPESFPTLSSLEPVPTDWLIETAWLQLLHCALLPWLKLTPLAVEAKLTQGYYAIVLYILLNFAQRFQPFWLEQHSDMSDSSLDELSAKITKFIDESENVVAQVRYLERLYFLRSMHNLG